MAYITRIHVEQCRNVRQLDIDLSVSLPTGDAGGPASARRPKFRHLILTGPNGSGKSGVLGAIRDEVSTGLVPPRHQQLTLPSFGGAGNALAWSCDAADLDGMFQRGDLIAVYLSATRRLRRHDVPGPKRLRWEPADLRPDQQVASKLLQFLVNKRTEMAYAAEDGDLDTASRINSWFENLERRLRQLMEDEGLSLEFDRRSYNFHFQKSDGYVFDFNTLADGHAAVLALLAELLIRVDAAQQSRNDFTFEPEGIVIVDEIETHLHLSLQEQILPFLTDFFPRFQFLVATHSPAVVASIPNAVVYDLKKREQTLSDGFRGVRYGTLMTEHFGISSEIDLDSTEKLHRLRELARRSPRTPEEERMFIDLAVLLSARSPTLAVEVWMAKEQLGSSGAAATEQVR
ncbi:AAA family ATPase [Sorangium sp. So ce1024]|uniref:AAA family ATPase n=1 Tax=Sorangium sp. So ce1024 TaxID=3133327 RepID=UPI003F03EC1D